MKRRDLIEIIEALRDAGRLVVENWSSGDLAGAVHGLEGTLEQADAALEWWASDDE